MAVIDAYETPRLLSEQQETSSPLAEADPIDCTTYG